MYAWITRCHFSWENLFIVLLLLLMLIFNFLYRSSKNRNSFKVVPWVCALKRHCLPLNCCRRLCLIFLFLFKVKFKSYTGIINTKYMFYQLKYSTSYSSDSRNKSQFTLLYWSVIKEREWDSEAVVRCILQFYVNLWGSDGPWNTPTIGLFKLDYLHLLATKLYDNPQAFILTSNLLVFSCIQTLGRLFRRYMSHETKKTGWKNAE